VTSIAVAPGTPIPVDANPFGIAITSEGTTAYVAYVGSGTVTPIAVDTYTLGTPVPLPAGSGTAGIAVDKSSPTQDPGGLPARWTRRYRANAFLYRRIRLLSVTHAPDPGVKKALPSTERQPSGGNRGPFMAVAIIYQSASRRCPADAAKLAPNGPLGVADTRGLVCTPSGEQRPGRIQWPAAGTHGTAEDDHHGRSLRWLRSWRGDLTVATAKPNSERATTGGDRPWPPTSYPAAGGAAAARADGAP
jgi:hypothetical protein